MKKTTSFLFLALAICVLFVFYLYAENQVLSGFQPKYTYTSFNRSNATDAQTIFTYWLESDVRTDALKNLIRIDYAFMVVYFVLLFSILRLLQRSAVKKWKQTLLKTGIVALILFTCIDIVQDGMIYHFISTKLVNDMRVYTKVKFVLLAITLLTIVAGVLPKRIPAWKEIKAFFRKAVPWTINFLSSLLKSVWLFFPGLFFMLILIFCFWKLGQGKDFIVAFAENRARAVGSGKFSWNYMRLGFFIAIGFWIYVSWYSARIISYIKQKKQLEPVNEIKLKVNEPVPLTGKTYPAINSIFLDNFPRLIGNACFLVLELAIIQCPLVPFPISSAIAWLLFALLLLSNYFLNDWIKDSDFVSKPSFRRLFNILIVIFLVLLFISCFFSTVYFITLLVFLMLLHAAFIVFINIRREDLRAKARLKKFSVSRTGKKIMDVFCIPHEESTYYYWFIGIVIVGVLLYLLNINSLGFARRMGPFPLVILGFGVLLFFGNFVTAFSVKYRLNFHVILLLLAFVLRYGERHEVRMKNLTESRPARPELKEYLQAWLTKNDTDSTRPINMYFVMSNGGASRSGYWTALVLGTIEDSTQLQGKKFSDKLFCLSGTSGGGVGVASFFAALNDKDAAKDISYKSSLKAFLQRDYFTSTFARLMGPDFFYYVGDILPAEDRAALLEESFEKSVDMDTDSVRLIHFDKDFSSFPALVNNKINLPVLCVNTTRMQDGTPGVVTNLNMDDSIFNSRIDVMKLVPPDKSITLASGAILGARFPYLSPAGRIGDSYFVDGGYFDNSGAGVVQEMIHGIINIAKDPAYHNEMVKNQIHRIWFHVIHIVNSPIGSNESSIKAVPAIQNDLMSPILTILGAYDMQTAVNDVRLINYLKDIQSDGYQSQYARISLYKNDIEWNKDKLSQKYFSEPPYAMNWFMSDTTIRRIDERLRTQDSLKAIIREMKN